MKVYVCVPESMLQEVENKSSAIVNRVQLIVCSKTTMNYVHRMRFEKQYKFTSTEDENKLSFRKKIVSK